MVAPPTLLQQQPDILTLAQAPIPQEDMKRKQDMKRAWDSYRGNFPDPLTVEKDQPNDNVKPNRCGPIVDKGAAWLFNQVLKVLGDDQDFIDGLWGDDDDRMTLLSEMSMNGGVCGMNFVKLIPATGAMKFPRIVLQNPMNIRIVTLPEDCSLHLAYIIEYPGFNDWQKRQIIARIDPDNDLETVGSNDPKDTWTITNYVRRGSGSTQSTWQQVGDLEEWPYPFPPIFCNKNLPNPNEAWGFPDLPDDLIAMNKVLNFNQSNISRIIKFFADPKLWATGVSAEQIRMALGAILVFESPEAKLNALEAHGDLSGPLNFSMELRGDMDEQSRVPAVALGRLADLPKGNISGVALQLLFQPLIEKTTLKRRLYGKLIREVTRAALVVSGRLPVEQYDSYKIELPWPNLLPIDDLAAAQTAQLLKALGVSQETLMAELGYNADEENEKSQKEAKQQLQNFAHGVGLPPASQPLPGQPPQQTAQLPAPAQAPAQGEEQQ